jgi:outer membrane protein OmpA-like peptidoglycan-associated protein
MIIGLQLIVMTLSVGVIGLAQGRSDLKFSATAVTFPVDKKIEMKLRGTTRYSRTTGSVNVEYKDGLAKLSLSVKELDPPSQRQYTTYVFWAVTPEGLTDNIGELRPRKTSVLGIFSRSWGGTIETATRFRTFCIVLTAEPHFLVEAPSREVVVASLPPDEKEGLETEPVEVNFRGDIGLESVPWREDRISTRRDRETPVELLEARRALDIGRYYRVEQHAAKEFKLAESLLTEAERAFDNGVDETSATLARRAVAAVEVARRLARERRDAEERRKRESSLADLEDQVKQTRRELASSQKEAKDLDQTIERKNQELRESTTKISELTTALDQAERLNRQLANTERGLREQLDAVAKRATDAETRLTTEQARSKGLEDELTYIRQSSVSINELRAKVALTRIAETRGEDEGFVIVLPNDLLFAATRRPASGVPQLKPEALPKLDYISKVLAMFPLGEYVVEGHVSGPGSTEKLQEVSQANAAAVVAYLLSKGVPSARLKPVGRGPESPLDTAKTPQALRRNQRVEIAIRRN